MESNRYPGIVFTPDRVEGTVEDARLYMASSGFMAAHELTVAVTAQAGGDKVNVTAHFVLPYTEWGMKNLSSRFLRCSDKVNTDVHAVGV